MGAVTEKLKVMSDKDVLARILWGESRGEPIEGQVAVACVVMNRVNIDLGNDGKPDWWGEGVKGVCLKAWQFSCVNDNDPNSQKLLDPPHESDIFNRCLTIAELAIKGLLKDPTNGSTHYFSDSIPMPSWVKGMRFRSKIGRHSFYS